MSLKGRNLPKSARCERFVERFLKHHKCIVISKYSEIGLRKTAGAVGKERLKQTYKVPDRTHFLLLVVDTPAFAPISFEPISL